MVVKKAFEILKGRWKILLKRLDMSLWTILDMVMTCICFHNLCTIHGNNFDMEWAQEVEQII
jgi:hypothetical protein